VTKRFCWKHTAAVQSISEVHFMKLKVVRHFLNILNQILPIVSVQQNKPISLFYMNMLCISHFNWKRRKLVGHNKVKICKL